MVTNQKHSTDSALSSENRVLVKRLDDYYSQHRKLKKKVNRLEKYVEEHLNWLTDDVGKLFDIRHCNCSSSSESSSSESSDSNTIKHKGVQKKIRKKNVYSRNKINYLPDHPINLKWWI
jgi:hypothetical protein